VNHGVPESDWKIFRELRELALERFCKRVLDELPRFGEDTSRNHHERYLELYGWLQDRDDELARAFNDPRRSGMLLQLAVIHALGLLEPDELARFTSETRDSVQSIAKVSKL
jgi:hypothetical protein